MVGVCTKNYRGERENESATVIAGRGVWDQLEPVPPGVSVLAGTPVGGAPTAASTTECSQPPDFMHKRIIPLFIFLRQEFPHCGMPEDFWCHRTFWVQHFGYFL